MKFIPQEKWHEIQKRYLAWWQNGSYDRPLMRVVAPKAPSGQYEPPKEITDPSQMSLDMDYIVQNAYYQADTHAFVGDSIPIFSARMGPGTLALYLGAEPGFAWDTVWFEPCMTDITQDHFFRANPSSKWFAKAMEIYRTAKARMGDDFVFAFPDMVENIDILAAMRGAQDLCIDMMDSPEEVLKRIAQIDVLYEYYYDQIYDFVKFPDGSSYFSAFGVWGHGRTAKIQCDFAALISKDQFRTFALPSLARQCRYINNTVFHLDGPQAMKHVDALMEIRELNALQFTCGEMRPDGTNAEWWEVYDKARAANKALWVQVYDGDIDQWIKNCDRFIKRYGAHGLYFVFPEFPDEQTAQQMIRKAELDWH